MIFDHYSIDRANDAINSIISSITAGFCKEATRKNLGKAGFKHEFEELFSIAKARMKNKKIKKCIDAELFMNEDDFRFATSSAIAKYRADKLKASILIDACSGVGLQSIFFAKTCKKVFAVEIDSRKSAYAEANCKILGINNVHIINADVTKAGHLPFPEAVFCDPGRPPSEETRSLNSLQPKLPELLKAFPKCKRFVVELPPRIDINLLTGIAPNGLHHFVEFISLDGTLSRLDLNIQKKVSAMIKLSSIHDVTVGSIDSVDYDIDMLDSEMPAVNLPASELSKTIQNDSPNFLYEVDSGVQRAGLIAQLLALDPNLSMYDDKQCFLASNKKIEKHALSFVSNSYQVLKNVLHCNSGQLDCHDPLKCNDCIKNIRSALIELGASKVVLRAKISPSEYWTVRNKLEQGLDASASDPNKILHLIVQKNILVCEKI